VDSCSFYGNHYEVNVKIEDELIPVFSRERFEVRDDSGSNDCRLKRAKKNSGPGFFNLILPQRAMNAM
jgi:hypothetical protein